MWSLRSAPAPARLRAGWSPGEAVLRALAAGALVGAVTLAAGRLGPALSATLIPLPVGLIFVAAWVLRAAPPEAALQVMSAGASGTVALALFLVVLRGLLTLHLSPVLAVALAATASVALATLIGVRRIGPARPGHLLWRRSKSQKNATVSDSTIISSTQDAAAPSFSASPWKARR